MAKKSISEETLKTNHGLKNRPFLLQSCQKKRNERGYEIYKGFVAKLLDFRKVWAFKNQVTSVL